jgi:hypothetical protein
MRKSGVITTALFVVLLGAVFIWMNSRASARARWEADVKYVKDLCAQNGRDEIYKVIPNVKGIMQIRPKPSSINLADQQLMPDPWGHAQGDSAEPAISLGGPKSYWFLEQVAENAPTGTYLRSFEVRRARLEPTDYSPVLSNKALSEFGYLTEDLTTPEMRKRWIGAGRISIIDLKTREVIARRTGYFRAIGEYAKHSWAGSSAYQNGRICPSDSMLSGFLEKVLIPPDARPSKEQIKMLREG